MRRDDAIRLRHMFDAAREALSFARSVTEQISTMIACWCLL
jgi:uncharacterized protein with HEPN domain